MHIVGGHVAAAHAATASLIISAACLAASPAGAAGTLAGTAIVNVATATYTDDLAALQTVTSNSASILVDEVIDVVASVIGAQPLAVSPGATEYRMTFRVTNTGNGPESVSLLASAAHGGDSFDPLLLRIVVDRDGDGLYDPLVDTVFAAGSEPLLAPDSSVDVFVFFAIPAAVAAGDQGILGVTAAALTASGTPGTRIAGAGVGGSNAVVGNSTASATATGTIQTASALPVLAKSHSLDGPGPAVRGSIVTYTLTANLGGTAMDSALVADTIPVGTRFLPGSLRLDGAPLTDAADGDAGMFTGTEIEVVLAPGDAGEKVVSFQVEIN